jgi:hypothetical protein
MTNRRVDVATQAYLDWLDTRSERSYKTYYEYSKHWLLKILSEKGVFKGNLRLLTEADDIFNDINVKILEGRVKLDLSKATILTYIFVSFMNRLKDEAKHSKVVDKMRNVVLKELENLKDGACYFMDVEN